MSAPTLSEWFASLCELQESLEEQGREDVGYGFCCVADPRDFHPDPEYSTEEERVRHKADCERAAKGLPKETQTTCQHLSLPNGGEAIVTPSGYGLGTYTSAGDETAADAAEQLLRIIGQIQMWREERLSDEERAT